VETVATPSPREHAVPDDTAERRWRERLLPFMARMLLALSAFFLVASLIQLTYLQSRIWNAPKGNLASVEQLLAAQPADPVADRLAVFRARAALGLEALALERRYHQANVQLMARVWMRYLGFLTGMILALVGASFILGGLRSPRSRVTAGAAGGEFSIASASPGIVLAVLGVVLMVATVVTRHLVEVTDAPVYVKAWPSGAAQSAPAAEKPAEGDSAAPRLDPLSAPSEPSS
jgi:hypothetical protein